MRTTSHNAARTIEVTDFIVPERKARKVVPREAIRNSDVEDAVFEVVKCARPSGNSFRRDMPPARAASSRNSFDKIGGATILLEQGLMALSPQAFVVLLSCLCVSVFWLFGGFSAFAESRNGPGQNRNAWTLVDTSVREVKENGMPLAIVHGRIENRTSAAIPMPQLIAQIGSTSLGRVTRADISVGADGHAEFSVKLKLSGGKASDIRLISVAE